MSSTKKEYWQFSFEQFGEHDVPSAIEYITATTGEEKIDYIGHSQGTLQMFIALSNPEVAARIKPKLKHFIALGPVGYIRTLGSVLMNFIVMNAEWFVTLEELFGVNQLFPYTKEKGASNAIQCEDYGVMC